VANGEAGEEGCGGEDEEEDDHAEAAAGGLGDKGWASGNGFAFGAALGFFRAGFLGFADDGGFGGWFFAGEGFAFFVGELEVEGDIAEFDGGSVAEGDDAFAFAFEFDAVGGADVAEFVAAFDADHFGVFDGNGAAVDGDVVFAAAPEGDDLAVELEAVGLGVFVRNGDRDAWHLSRTWVRW